MQLASGANDVKGIIAYCNVIYVTLVSDCKSDAECRVAIEAVVSGDRAIPGTPTVKPSTSSIPFYGLLINSYLCIYWI